MMIFHEPLKIDPMKISVSDCTPHVNLDPLSQNTVPVFNHLMLSM